jgi:hypothetical protein
MAETRAPLEQRRRSDESDVRLSSCDARRIGSSDSTVDVTRPTFLRDINITDERCGFFFCCCRRLRQVVSFCRSAMTLVRRSYRPGCPATHSRKWSRCVRARTERERRDRERERERESRAR